MAVGQQVEHLLGWHARVQQPVLGIPERLNGRQVLVERRRYPGDVGRDDHVRLLAKMGGQDRPGGDRAAVALVLGVLGAADPLLEGEGDVGHGLHQLGMHGQEEGMPEVPVAGRVEHLGDRLPVGQFLAGASEHGPHGVGQQSL